MKNFLIYLVFLTLLWSCGNTPQNTTDCADGDAPVIQKKDLRNYVHSLRGSVYIKGVEVKCDIAKVYFVKSFAEYQKLYPGPGATQEQYSSYFKQSEIEKIFVENSVKILKKFPKLNQVFIQLPWNEKNYITLISRDEVMDFINASFYDLNDDWKNNFADKYIFNEEGRATFFNHFVQTK